MPAARSGAQPTAQRDAALAADFDRLYRIWFACGFSGVFRGLGIYWLYAHQVRPLDDRAVGDG